MHNVFVWVFMDWSCFWWVQTRRAECLCSLHITPFSWILAFLWILFITCWQKWCWERFCYMRTLSCWPSLIRHSSQRWLDAFPRPKMEWVNIDMPCVSWEVKGHHKLPKRGKKRKCSKQILSPESKSFPNHLFQIFVSSCQATVEVERSLAPCGPSYTPTHLLLTLDLHSSRLLSQQPPEASSNILKRPAENDEIWRLETGASLWPVNGF